MIFIPPAPPRLTLEPTRQVVRPGDTVTLNCIASGAQPIDIVWRKEGANNNIYLPPSVIINRGEMMVGHQFFIFGSFNERAPHATFLCHQQKRNHGRSLVVYFGSI